MSDRDTHRESACQQMLPLLQLYADGEFDPADQAAIEGHLAECEHCARQVHFQRALTIRLRNAVLRADEAVVPANLELRLQRSMRRARVGAEWPRLLVPAASAAGLLMFFTFATGGALNYMINETVARHVDDLRVDFASQDPARLERLLSKKMGFAVRVPQFSAPQVSLRGARVVSFDRRPAAYLVYGTPRSKISVIALPDPARQVDVRDERLPQPDGRPLRIERQDGYNVVVWRQQDMLYSMASELQPQEMLELFFQKRPPSTEPSQAPLPIVPVSY